MHNFESEKVGHLSLIQLAEFRRRKNWTSRNSIQYAEIQEEKYCFVNKQEKIINHFANKFLLDKIWETR